MTVAGGVVRLTEAQTSRAGEVLARSFFDDPMFAYIQPDRAERARTFPAFFAAAATYGLRAGEVYTTSGTVDGAALWIPPAPAAPQEDTRGSSGSTSPPSPLGDDAGERLRAVMTHFGELHRRAVPSPHWYLLILGVDPPRQGQGVGGQLLAPVLARADRDRLPCYLETMNPHNLPFYRRHGFGVVEDADFPGGGFHYWTMLRRPRTEAGTDPHLETPSLPVYSEPTTSREANP